MFVNHLISVLMGPTYALPIDIFRILVGLLSFIFFLRTYLETYDFSNPDGLIDHVLSQDRSLSSYAFQFLSAENW